MTGYPCWKVKEADEALKADNGVRVFLVQG